MSHYIEDVAAEVAVPADGTLSRSLYDEDVRLVAFAFDAGQQLTEHSTPRPLILQAHSGRLEITASGATHELTPASWLYLEPGEPHSVTAFEPSVMLLTLL